MCSPSFRASFLGLTLILAVACGDDDVETREPAVSEPEGEALYAIASMIFSDQEQSSYLALLPTFDRSDTVRFDDAREFAGYAPADVAGDTLLIANGESPTVTEFTIDADGAWNEGRTLSFSRYTNM